MTKTDKTSKNSTANNPETVGEVAAEKDKKTEKTTKAEKIAEPKSGNSDKSETKSNDTKAIENKQFSKIVASIFGKIKEIFGVIYSVLADIGEYIVKVFVGIAKYIGLCFLYIIGFIANGFSRIKKPFVDFFKHIGETLASPFKRHHKARKIATSKISKARKEEGRWGGFKAWLKVAGQTLFGKRGIFATVVNWGLPIVSCVFLFNIIAYANSQNYAVKLTVNGDFVGYISDETAFTEAEKMVQNRINYTGSNIEVISFEPTYEVENIGSEPLMNQYQVADSMLALLGKQVKEGYGLYLDNSFYGTLSSHNKLDKTLDDMLKKYKTSNSKETVEFDKQVNYIKGTYLADSFVDEDDIVKLFTSKKKVATYYTIVDGDCLSTVLDNTDMSVEELARLNPGFDEDYAFYTGDKLKITSDEPFLNIKITREEHYTETYAYDTEYVDDDSVYSGNKIIKTEGEKGERSVVADVSYINGTEVSRKILSKTITKEPVTEVIAVGTKPREATTAPEQTIEAGLMLWPVGGYDGGYIEENVWWKGGYYGHNGIDIAAPYGTPVYAAENGVVTSAVFDNGYNGGRGNYVIIQGDSGYTTYYYHNSEVVAYPGQRVTAGELIAYVGSTGESYGYHCHFGVSVGGTYLDPVDFLPAHASVAAYY